MTSLPGYEASKEISDGWLESVPAHWKALPCRAIVCERTERNEQGECQDYLSLMANVGVIPYAEKGDIGNKKPDDLTKCKVVFEGDFIINSMNYYIGSYGASNYRGVCSPVYVVLTPVEAVVNPRFAFRIFENKRFQEFAQSFGNGILEHRRSINWDTLKVIPVPVPPLEEQLAIATFLDRETAKIDALVAEQRRLIALLKEKRQAVISHAVTKGLNPDAPMKPSGIEWLGDVPEHWDVARVKFVSSRISKGDTPSNFGMEFAVDGPVRFIKIENIGEGYLIETPRYSIGFEAHDQLKRSQLQANDVLFAIAGATTGKCAMVSQSYLPANTNQAVAYIRPNDRVVPNFLIAWLQSRGLRESMWETTVQSAQPNLSMESLGNLSLLVPPFVEQEAIVKEVEANGGRYLSLIAQAERAIELLQERRTALISAAVTGKIDVREHAMQETA